MTNDDFINNYEIAFYYKPDGNKYKLTNGETPSLCRFCHKSYPEVKFRKKAHALSEFTGSKDLLSDYECDECNHFFGTYFEDSLAKYIGPELLFSQTKGKKGIPKYKSKNELTIIESNDSTIDIHNIINSGNVTERDDSYEIKLEPQSYNKLHAYKALVKMALSVMPEEKIINFQETIEWLMKNKFDSLSSYASAVIEKTYLPYSVPLRATIFLRKEDCIKLPYCFFVIQFGCKSFQIVVPSLEKDRNLYENKTNVEIIDLTNMTNVETKAIDLSEDKVVKDDVRKLILYYDSKKETNN